MGVALSCRSRAGADSANPLAGAQHAETRPTAAQPRDAPPGTPAPKTEVAAGGARQVSACSTKPSELPRLEQFSDAEPGTQYWMEATYAAPDWSPEPAIRPLLHHRSRLELDNVDDFPEITGAPGQRLRFILELTHSEIGELPARHEFRSVYHARILRVCEPHETR